METTLDKIDELIEKWNALRFSHKNSHWDYRMQEDVKDLAWRLVREYIDLKQYRHAAFYLLHGVITPHYWRARQALENSSKCKTYLKKIRGKKYYPLYELDIDHYTCHWLAANEDRPDLYPKEVIQAIDEHFSYRPEKNKYLPEGMSVYRGFDL